MFPQILCGCGLGEEIMQMFPAGRAGLPHWFSPGMKGLGSILGKSLKLSSSWFLPLSKKGEKNP